jgi:hypothetical protein
MAYNGMATSKMAYGGKCDHDHSFFFGCMAGMGLMLLVFRIDGELLYRDFVKRQIRARYREDIAYDPDP